MRADGCEVDHARLDEVDVGDLTADQAVCQFEEFVLTRPGGFVVVRRQVGAGAFEQPGGGAPVDRGVAANPFERISPSAGPGLGPLCAAPVRSKCLAFNCRKNATPVSCRARSYSGYRRRTRLRGLSSVEPQTTPRSPRGQQERLKNG